MGRASSLIHGIDCPHHSVYQNVVVFSEGTAKLAKDAMCIFEIYPPVPLRRHHHSTSSTAITCILSNKFLTSIFIRNQISLTFVKSFKMF